jgi:DNA-binding transcriptional LysR family regulator
MSKRSPSLPRELNVSHTVMPKQVRQPETLRGAQLFNRTTAKRTLVRVLPDYLMRAR